MVPSPPSQLVRPDSAHLKSYVDALRRGWSPDNMRGAEATQEQLQQIAADADAFLAQMHDPQGLGPPVTLPDGTQRPRVPSLRRWMWDSTDDSFAGSIGLRWAHGGAALPPHVLGHIGYAVVPWKQRQGFATRALAMMLPLAREQGLASVDITTDPHNLVSQYVITANGGVLVESFDKGAAYGHAPGLRFRIGLLV
jgi:predicted acetyltransferase